MEFAEKSGGSGKIAFKFADGTYEFAETAIFEAGASGNRKVLIEGSGNTVFCGTARIDASELRELRDKSALAKLPPERRAKVYFLDLKKFGISDCGEPKQKGFGTPRDVPGNGGVPQRQGAFHSALSELRIDENRESPRPRAGESSHAPRI